jgi:hypothetical protein
MTHRGGLSCVSLFGELEEGEKFGASPADPLLSGPAYSSSLLWFINVLMFTFRRMPGKMFPNLSKKFRT